ncbi:MAG: hypothetical protein AAGI15_14885 [Pseudomonadota bacterium]
MANITDPQGTLSPVRRSIYPQADDSWERIATRELPDLPLAEATGLLQSWNLHVFMRPAPPADSPRAGNPILPSDVVFLEPPQPAAGAQH